MKKTPVSWREKKRVGYGGSAAKSSGGKCGELRKSTSDHKFNILDRADARHDSSLLLTGSKYGLMHISCDFIHS
jgi:hypothetical protein